MLIMLIILILLLIATGVDFFLPSKEEKEENKMLEERIRSYEND